MFFALIQVDLVAQILLEEISHRRTQMSLGKIHYNNVCFTSIGTTGSSFADSYVLTSYTYAIDAFLLSY